MVIVFVEDRVLKLFVEKLRWRFGISCRPRMPKTGGGGWSCVLERVRDSDPKKYRILGIIEGDSKERAETWESWSEVSELVFVTNKNELEEYLFEKLKSFDSFTDLPTEIQYREFKHFFNKDAAERVVNRVLSELSKQECEEIINLVRFIKGS